jgi:hypothetical protein
MFSPFNCVSSGRSSLVLHENPSVPCYDSEWRSFVALDIFFIVLYIGVVPLLVILKVKKFSKGALDFNTLLQPMTHFYQPNAKWFEFWKLGLKLMFV